MSKKTFLFVCSIVLIIPIMALAGAEHSHDQQDINKMSGEATTFVGMLICKNCSLKKEFGACSECKTNGCQLALRTSDGLFVNFLDNKYAKDFKGTKYTGKK